jgi:hypothetical protein
VRLALHAALAASGLVAGAGTAWLLCTARALPADLWFPNLTFKQAHATRHGLLRRTPDGLMFTNGRVVRAVCHAGSVSAVGMVRVEDQVVHVLSGRTGPSPRLRVLFGYGWSEDERWVRLAASGEVWEEQRCVMR